MHGYLMKEIIPLLIGEIKRERFEQAQYYDAHPFPRCQEQFSGIVWYAQPLDDFEIDALELVPIQPRAWAEWILKKYGIKGNLIDSMPVLEDQDLWPMIVHAMDITLGTASLWRAWHVERVEEGIDFYYATFQSSIDAIEHLINMKKKSQRQFVCGLEFFDIHLWYDWTQVELEPSIENFINQNLPDVR